MRRGDDLILASYGRICVAMWNVQPTLPLFEEQHAALTACVARHPGHTAFLCVVSDHADPPESPVRSASAKMMKDLAKGLVGCACVIEGVGFRASVTRSVLTGITLLARSPVPLSFFSRISESLDWVGPRVEHSVVGLAEQLNSLRRT
jgi:hypothetical protein